MNEQTKKELFTFAKKMGKSLGRQVNNIYLEVARDFAEHKRKLKNKTRSAIGMKRRTHDR